MLLPKKEKEKQRGGGRDGGWIMGNRGCIVRKNCEKKLFLLQENDPPLLLSKVKRESRTAQ